MPSSGTHPAPTRRAVLATCGAAVLAGCSDVLATSSPPPIECVPTAYSWPMYGYDASHTSHVGARDLPPTDAEARRFSRTSIRPRGGGSADASPVVREGIAYTAGDVRIEARDIETGERRWETDPGDSVGTSPVVACGSVYVSTLNETLALDTEDGSVLWRADVGTHTEASASPVVLDDTIYVAGGAVALDAETGTERWHTRGKYVTHGAAVGDRVYIGGGSNGSGEVVAVTHSGEDWWRTTDLGPIYTTPVVAGETVYAVSKKGTLTALAAADGRVQWQTSVESGVYEPPAVADGRVVVGAGNGTRTIAFDAATGERLWAFETGVSQGGPVVFGDRVLATGANTGVHVLNTATGELVRRWPVGNVGSQPVLVDGRLFYRAGNVSDVFVIG